jgi:hypothetical protein
MENWKWQNKGSVWFTFLVLIHSKQFFGQQGAGALYLESSVQRYEKAPSDYRKATTKVQ